MLRLASHLALVAAAALLLQTRAARAEDDAPPPAPAPEDAPPPPPEPPAPSDAPDDAAPAPPAEPAASEPAAPAPAPDEAAPPPAPPAPPPAPAAPPPAATGDAKKTAAGVADTRPAHRVGDPIPLTRRSPTLNALGFMVGVRYGLVGTGPTRFVDDVRFGVTDWLEVRTDLLPYPASLMVRGRYGSPQDDIGAFLLDAGLAHWDAGFRIVPEEGEPSAGVRFHFEGVAGYMKTLGDRTEVSAYLHYRYRLSLLNDDDEHAVAADGHITYDLLDSLAVSAGLGLATTVGTPVRELSVNFVETDRPGISHLLNRLDGDTQSITIPLSMTYGRVENFDVDLFCTPRVWPELGVLFGAGVRLRLDPFT